MHETDPFLPEVRKLSGLRVKGISRHRLRRPPQLNSAHFYRASLAQTRAPWHASMEKRWTYPAILVIVTFLVWGISLPNRFVWDDRILIQKNEVNISRMSLSMAFLSDFWSTDTEAGRSNYYRPLVTLSYMVDYALFGLQPIGYHATKIRTPRIWVVCLSYLLIQRRLHGTP